MPIAQMVRLALTQVCVANLSYIAHSHLIMNARKKLSAILKNRS